MLSPKSQGESLLINSPKSQNNRFIQYELAEQKLQATKKKTMKSMFNQQISLNSEQKRKQRKIKLANSRLLKQNSFQNSNQIQNTYENITQKSQETQETLFKGLGKQDHFKKSQSIYSEGKQQDKDGISQIINTEKLKTTYEYYLKKTKVIQSKSVMKDIQNKIFKMKFFRVSDYQKSQGLDKLDKKAIDNHINQSLDIQQLYRDIIFLKKAASILLTKDQLAIIQLIGLSSEYLKQSGKMSYFEEQYSILNNNELQEKYISLFFKRVIDNEFFKKSEYQKSQGLDQIDKSFIDNHVNKSLNILQIYRDIIFLKKATSILLSKDQLAVLQLVGLSSEFLKNGEKDQQKCEIQNENKEMSYFEEQYSILNENDLQEKYINSFFKRMFDNQQISEVDLRILDSL
ncbi:hypothetical protein ABPG73_008895 [Tetrahymena malaccensis]